MPIFSYFMWVGAGLLTLLFAAGSVLPQPETRVENPMSYRIAVAAQTRGPEAVSFSGENRIFAQPPVAVAEAQPADKRVLDAFARLNTPEGSQKLNDNTPELRTAKDAPKAKKTVKRKTRQPSESQQMAERDFIMERRAVAYSRSYDASPYPPRLFW